MYSLVLKDYPHILNITEMSKILYISSKTGKKLLKNGDIQSMKIGLTYRIPKVHVLEYMQIINHRAR